MQNKGKSKILIIVIIILAILSGLAIALSLITKENNKPSEISKEMTELKLEEDFFGIQKIINNFYENLSLEKKHDLYISLEEDYKKVNNITENNIISMLKINYNNIDYIVSKIYYNKDGNVKYYFINGYIRGTQKMENTLSFIDNKNFLVIVSMNNNYVIKPLEDNINLYQYANNYNMVDIKLKNNMKFEKVYLDEKNKLANYINEFKNLLFYNTEKAYNMLGEETKNKYLNYNDFKNQIESIYNNITASVFSYNKKEQANYNEYLIIDDNKNNLKIIENGIMNYQISY